MKLKHIINSIIFLVFVIVGFLSFLQILGKLGAWEFNPNLPITRIDIWKIIGLALVCVISVIVAKVIKIKN